MENPRPQLSLAELFQLRWFLGGVLGLVSAWTLFYMEVDALLALALLTLTIPVFTIWPHLSRALPSFVHRLAFPLIVTIFALDLWGNREPLPAMIRLDLMLLGYRCIAPRSSREDLQLILLSLFLVVVTGVFTVSPAFVVQILFFTAVALGLLLAVTLSDARAGGRADSATGWERVRWRELFTRVRSVLDLRVLGLGGALFAGVVGLSVVLFLALPRVEITNSFFLDKLITKKTRTGFSEDVRFGEVVDIAEDTSMAFAVDVSNPAAVPAEPYWRMLVLDEYSGDGFRVSRGLRDSFLPAREKSHVHGGVGRSREDRTVWIVYFQPGVSRYLPLMGGFSRLAFGEPQALLQSPPLRVAALQSEPSKMIGYRVEGMDTDGILRDRVFARDKKVAPAEVRERRPRLGPNEDGATYPFGEDAELVRSEPTFLELEGVSETDRARLTEWVAQIGGAGEGGGDFARRSGTWLQSRHSYSMRSRTPEGEGDVLIRWMGSTEPGHCELFAGSIVLLARAAGVPARLVTGFKGGVWNETSGHISVKNSDAHAWTEIWDEPLGSWLRVDATPGSQLTPGRAADVSAGAGAEHMARDIGWGARLDGLRIFWYRRIVSFDQGSQLELLRGTKDKIRLAIEGLRGAVESRLRAFLEWVREPWDFSRVAGLALVLGFGSGAVVLWHRAGRAWWLAWRSRRAASHGHDPVRREAARWLSRLDGLDREWAP
ncbi:MAG: DUF3488 domain-containing protein, partial [Burkholderiales bacterium]|nr:DUF3488 domain-containing protein [Opitutaceae bacterium]